MWNERITSIKQSKPAPPKKATPMQRSTKEGLFVWALIGIALVYHLPTGIVLAFLGAAWAFSRGDDAQ